MFYVIQFNDAVCAIHFYQLNNLIIIYFITIFIPTATVCEFDLSVPPACSTKGRHKRCLSCPSISI